MMFAGEWKDGASMNDEYFKKVFAKNLEYYIKASGKKQKEVAKDLGLEPTTFNTWCVGKILPHSGKIQAIADYFGIEKTDLTEEHVEGLSWMGVDEDELSLHRTIAVYSIY